MDFADNLLEYTMDADLDMDFSEPEDEKVLTDLSNSFFPKDFSQDTGYGSCSSWASQPSILSEIQQQLTLNQLSQHQSSQHNYSQQQLSQHTYSQQQSSQHNYSQQQSSQVDYSQQQTMMFDSQDYDLSQLLVLDMDSLPLPSETCSQLTITDNLVPPVSSQHNSSQLMSEPEFYNIQATQRSSSAKKNDEKRYVKIEILRDSTLNKIVAFAAYRVTIPTLYRVDVIDKLYQLGHDLNKAINNALAPNNKVSKRKTNTNKEKVSKEIIRSVPPKSILFDKMAGLVVDELNKKYKKLTVAQMKSYIFLLEKLIQTVQSNTYTTSRDLFYKNMKQFQTVNKLQTMLKDIYVTQQLSHLDCHIIARPNGFVYGDLTYIEDGYEINCKMVRNGLTIPTNSRLIQFKPSAARFILVVEKQATFIHLAGSSIFKLFNFVMITGCGYPNLSTREFLQKLWLTLKIPIFALVDCDAFGFEIMCNYCFGSYQMAHENNRMIAPEVAWLGVLPHEVKDLKLKGIKFSDYEQRRLDSIMKRQFIIDHKPWYQQLRIMRKLKSKVEIQELYNHSDSYLVDVYLPMKLSKGKWI